MRIAQSSVGVQSNPSFSQSQLGRPYSIAACALALQAVVDYRGRLVGKPVINRRSYLRCVCSRGGTRSTLREIWCAAERAHKEAFEKGRAMSIDKANEIWCPLGWYLRDLTRT